MDYSLYEERLGSLRLYLTLIRRPCARELLEKAVLKAQEDQAYAKEFEKTLCNGSTLEYRELFSPFGDYWAPPRPEFPPYPHSDAVNCIDSAMHHIKLGDVEDAIEFYNMMHNREESADA